MSIETKFSIETIPKSETKPWIMKKHYVHRMPPIQYSYGLFKKNEIQGVCTFGSPSSPKEARHWSFDIVELNRLVTKDNLPNNTLSYFVSHALGLIPKPMVVVAYADPNSGHHGYIYQATNWCYVGKMEPGGLSKTWVLDNQEYHGRNMMTEKIKELCGKDYDNSKTNYENFKDIGGEIIEQEGKYKYYYFHANKRDKRQMRKELRYEEKQYPKGDNQKYNTGKELDIQLRLINS